MAEQKKTKVRKKEWFPVVAREVLKNAFLGETFLGSPSEMVGRHITVNLMQITNESKNQNVNMSFLIAGTEGGKGIADPVGYEIMPSSIRRLVRKEKKKVDVSFICETADKVKIRIKPIFIIKKTTKGSTETAIRKYTRDFLTKAVQKLDYNSLILDMINYKLQDALRNHLKKVYPLKTCEIRQMYVVTASVSSPQQQQEEPKAEPQNTVNEPPVEIKAQ